MNSFKVPIWDFRIRVYGGEEFEEVHADEFECGSWRGVTAVNEDHPMEVRIGLWEPSFAVIVHESYHAAHHILTTCCPRQDAGEETYAYLIEFIASKVRDIVDKWEKHE